MNKPNLSKFITNTKVSIVKHSPEILTGVGIAGMITTTVLAVKATPKALDLIQEEKAIQDVNKLKAVEVVKVAWKPYTPAIISGMVSIACLIGASSENAKRNAAWAAAYKIAETSLAEYRDKVVETIGEKKELSIREKIDKDRIEKNPVTSNEVIFTGKGETLCYDVISGRYFNCDIETIRKVQNDLNMRMIGGDSYISLSQFYDGVGLEHTDISDRLGWNLYTDGQIDIRFGSQIAADGRPCIVVDYAVQPRYKFDDLM